MLKLPVRMLDDVLRLRPIRGRVDPDLVVLICSEQLGAVRWIEIGCDKDEKKIKNRLGVNEKTKKIHFYLIIHRYSHYLSLFWMECYLS